jgi:hypothetical protein
MEAVKERRVLTVAQEPGKKDSGEIGFRQTRFASYFVFPRPLPKDEPRRIIGINYQLVEEPEMLRRGASKESRRVAKSPRHGKAPARRIPKDFKVIVRRVATTETFLSVKAANKASARQAALRLVDRQPFDLVAATVRNQVKSVR